MPWHFMAWSCRFAAIQDSFSDHTVSALFEAEAFLLVHSLLRILYTVVLGFHKLTRDFSGFTTLILQCVRELRVQLLGGLVLSI